MNQSEIASDLAQHLWHDMGRMGATEQKINLLIVQWMLDNDIRFRKVDHANNCTTDTQQKAQSN